MATSRDDFVIAIRSAFLKKGNQQRFSLIALIFFSIALIALSRFNFPAINYLKEKKIKVSGPFSADTFFLEKNIKKFDVVVGMYHDQVLTPIKTLFKFDAINVTIGLPFIKVTPDHGPNNLMLGKNKSDPSSLIEAFKFIKSLRGN